MLHPTTNLTVPAGDLVRLKQQLKVTRLRLLEADRCYEAMRRSRSWHFTAPLRTAARVAPGVTQFLWLATKLMAWTLKGDLPGRIRGWKRARRIPAEETDAPAVASLDCDTPSDFGIMPRPRILVADWSLPNPELGAGNRICFQILKTLAESGFEVLFWADDRIDDLQTRTALETLGVTILNQNEAPDLARWLSRNGQTLSYVVLARPCLARKWIHAVLRCSDAFIAYFGHDLHHARLRQEAALARDPDLAERADRMLAVEREVWRLVDMVLYLSDDEAEQVRLLEPSVVARTLTAYAFDRFTARLQTPEGDDLLFVGGYAHRPNQDAALWLAKEIFPALRRAVPDARLILAGSDPTPEIVALASASVVVTGRITDEVLIGLYDRARLVLAPLRFGAGVKGKVVEALSAGAPLITTGVGAQGLPGLGNVVPVVDDPKRIVEAAVRLLNDDAAWLAQSKAQAAYAGARFSTEIFKASLLAGLCIRDDTPRRSDGVSIRGGANSGVMEEAGAPCTSRPWR